MHEYGIGLREIDLFWRPGRTLLYLRKIGDRYKRQNDPPKNKGKTKAMNESELLKSEFMKG